jgi:hypothetical protein
MSISVPNATSLQAQWITSSYSGGGNNCIQAAHLSEGTHALRDSKRPTGPALVLPAPAWAAFIGAARAGLLVLALPGPPPEAVEATGRAPVAGPCSRPA